MNDTELTRSIIGVAIEVQGPGLLESAYEGCLCHEPAVRGMRLLLEGRVVVELKSIDGIGPVHEAVMLTYLRLSGHPVWLLINFNVPVLKDGVRRFITPRDAGKGPFNTEFTAGPEKRPQSNNA